MKNNKCTLYLFALTLFILGSCGEPPIEWQETQTSEGETKTINLPDGSSVHLNENTYFKYPNEFTQSMREVELKGEAFFTSTKGEKTFLVSTASERITASVPSEFNVNTRETANVTSVNVASGGVVLRPNGGGAELELEKTVKGMFDREKEGLSRIRKSTGSDMFWHTKRLEFDDTYLARVIDDLIRVFNAEITVTNPDLVKCSFTYAADNANLKDVMNAFEKEFGVDVFEETPTIYSLTGGSCKK